MELLQELYDFIRVILGDAGITLKPGVSLVDLLTIIGLPFLLIISIYRYIYTHLTSTPENRALIVPWLESKMIDKYRGLVGGLLGLMTTFYGPPASSQAFGRSLSLAFAYPILLFFIAYSFWGGSHEFGGAALFPEAAEGLLTSFWVTVLIAIVLLTLILGGDWLEAKARKPFQAFLQSEKAQDISYRVTMAVLAALVTSTYNPDWKSILMMAGLGYWLGAFAVAGAVIFGNYTLSITFLLFLTLFPLLNALYDFLSLRVSRYYLQATQKEESALFILGDILVDLLIAIFFMVALAIVLSGVTEWVNAIYSQFDPKAVVDWRGYAQDAIDEPFGKGLMVTAMLITTLLPTVIHIFLGLLSFTINSAFGKSLAKYLDGVNGASLKASVAAIWLEAYFFFVIALLFVLYFGLQTLFELPLGQWLFAIAEKWHGESWLVISILVLLTVVALYKPILEKFISMRNQSS